jgi:hypothetical protein
MEWLAMSGLDALGRILLVLGAFLAALGVILLVVSRVPAAGRLPGDFSLRWGNVSCYFPLATGVVLSILLTLVLNVILWLLRK